MCIVSLQELWKTLSALGQGGGGVSKGHQRGVQDGPGALTSSDSNQNASSTSSSTAADGAKGDDDQDEEENEEEEEEEVEVGLDECVVLRDYLAAKKTQFGRILHRLVHA